MQIHAGPRTRKASNKQHRYQPTIRLCSAKAYNERNSKTRHGWGGFCIGKSSIPAESRRPPLAQFLLERSRSLRKHKDDIHDCWQETMRSRAAPWLRVFVRSKDSELTRSLSAVLRSTPAIYAGYPAAGGAHVRIDMMHPAGP